MKKYVIFLISLLVYGLIVFWVGTTMQSDSGETSIDGVFSFILLFGLGGIGFLIYLIVMIVRDFRK